ncbi:MAG: TlpA family protein disulfide reductase [Candidatus Omnitrophica bacterium]|nr:TlpA family protein disulfide reductase [Candidatus Omnitrophota bacterium]
MKKIICFFILLNICLFSLCLAPLKAEPNKAADFNLRDPWNKYFSLSQFKGRPVILNFFRIYCGGRIAPQTHKQFQELNKVCQKFCKDKNCAEADVAIIGITLATCPTTDLKEWAKYYDIKWLLGNDYDDYRLDVFNSYANVLSNLRDPALIFVNKDQEIVFFSNYLDSSEIISKLIEINPDLDLKE